MSCIYLWHNTKTDTIYIGQTSKTFEHRKRQHINNLRADRHANRHLQRAFNKYGETAFEVDTLEEIDNPAILEDAEYFWINYFRSIGAELYNIAPVGKSLRGVKRSDEYKQKVGAKKKQDWQNPEYREKVVSAMKAAPKSKRIYTEEDRQKRRERFSGENNPYYGKYGAEHPRHGTKCTPEHTAKRVESFCKKDHGSVIAPDGTVYHIGFNLNEFCRQHNLTRANMSKMLSGERATCKGWKAL